MAVSTHLAEPDVNPPYLYPDYRSTVARAPSKRLIELPREWFHHGAGPVYGRVAVRPGDNDLVHQHEAPPIGQVITLAGRVLDSDGRGVPDTLIEIWQANAAGRYVDAVDLAFMPLDPNFTGAGRTLTSSDGSYSFRTIIPASYAGLVGGDFRPAHIHISLFGPDLASRMVTQCYFEGDPRLRTDAIAQSIPDPAALDRLIAKWNPETTEPGDVGAALAYDWDIVIRGHAQTPMED
jgi:protocatechuate 3,4-dioxygenase, beta subunit